MDEQSIFLDIHQGLERESPGGALYTQQAFEMLPTLSYPQILDIGCGPGMQTLTLAQLSDGSITAVDNHQLYLTALQQQATAFPGRITCLNADMRNLPFAPQSFDLIWAEGSIYIIGLEEGLTQWRSLLKPGGYMVISELVWIKPNPPAVLHDYWQQGYPSMRSVEEVAALIPTHGYTLIGTMLMPSQAWWNYYQPLEERVNHMRQVYHDQPQALAVLDQEQQEITMYRTYGEWYGYSFFIMQTTS